MKAAANEMEYSSELLYDALIESTDDFIYMCNPKTGMFRYPATLVDMFGLPGEVVKHPLTYWKAIVHPEDWERFYKSNMEVFFQKSRLPLCRIPCKEAQRRICLDKMQGTDDIR